MITDRIGLHSVLLPLQNNKVWKLKLVVDPVTQIQADCEGNVEDIDNVAGFVHGKKLNVIKLA